MKIRSSIAPACLAAVFAALVAVGFGAEAEAQQPKATTKAAPAQKAPPAAKGEAPPPAEGQQGQTAIAIPTPWTKVCSKDPQANKEICLISQDLHADTGQFLASIAVREVQGEPKKQFIVAIPPGMQLQPGLRVVLDQQTPLPAKYSICFPNACYGDMDIDADFIGKMKKGQALTVQTINQIGRTVNFTLVLKDFAKSYDGPAVDPKVIESQRQKLQEELQKKAEEARKKLESQAK
jgi:invasion protein IalB